jgi:hypothetical protein
MTENNRDPLHMKLAAALNLLRGQVCWSVLAGAGTGSTMHLEFGTKVPRKVPLRDRPQITPTQARYEGEFDLFVECAWRLEFGTTVLCGSTDDDRNDGAHGLGITQPSRQVRARPDSRVSNPGCDDFV